MSLAEIGWNAHFEQVFEPYQRQDLLPGRVVREERAGYLVHTATEESMCMLAGRLRHESQMRGDLPAVGDWVAIRAQANGRSTIQAVLQRQSWIGRHVIGGRTEEQILATNVDLIFIVSGLDNNFNLRRIERYLTMTWQTGAAPVIVLNKADLCEELEARIADVTAMACGVPVCVTSALDDDGAACLREHLAAGKTVAFLGSSGVGKSTLINALLGEERQATAEVREGDSRGRHTTTHRELLVLPGGGVLIDTPGMRELMPWASEEAARQTFAEIDTLSANCKFQDCRHDTEPGCAVRAAIESGELEADRLSSYRKQQNELRYLESRRDGRLQREQKQEWKRVHREQRRAPKKRAD